MSWFRSLVYNATHRNNQTTAHLKNNAQGLHFADFVWFNSLVPERCGCNVKSKIFKLISYWATPVKLSCADCNRPHWWLVNNGFSNGLVMPLSWQSLTKFYDTVWRHRSTMNRLTKFTVVLQMEGYSIDTGTIIRRFDGRLMRLCRFGQSRRHYTNVWINVNQFKATLAQESFRFL